MKCEIYESSLVVSVGLADNATKGAGPASRIQKLEYRECGVMVAHGIWDAGERFESYIFYHT